LRNCSVYNKIIKRFILLWFYCNLNTVNYIMHEYDFVAYYQCFPIYCKVMKVKYYNNVLTIH